MVLNQFMRIDRDRAKLLKKISNFLNFAVTDFTFIQLKCYSLYD